MKQLFSIIILGIACTTLAFAQLQPKDNEHLVYPRPDAALQLKVGDKHPKLKGWSFFTAHEFNDVDTKDGQALGFVEHNTEFVSRMTRINNAACSEVKDGALHIVANYYADSIDNAYGKMVTLETAGFRTPKKGDGKETWCKFTENMRIEIRMKRSDLKGLNNALWFMGDNDKGWPANGEIDLLENPKKAINNKSHFTLHSENYYAGVVGGQGSTTASIDLEDMTRWNIYWLEWYPEKIVGGVNGETYFQHAKGENGNNDWPWSDPEGFYLLITAGISNNPKAWMGAVVPGEWDSLKNQTIMSIDWIRVYTNKEYRASKPCNLKFY